MKTNEAELERKIQAFLGRKMAQYPELMQAPELEHSDDRSRTPYGITAWLVR